MEPYRTDRPKVYADMPNSLTALLGRLADAGIPLTHTLYEYAMNPDAPVSETAQNLTDEFVPFKYQIRSGEATPSNLAKEAALWFSPTPGKRMKVRTMPDGTPNYRDLGVWYNNKLSQGDRLERNLAARDPSSRYNDMKAEYERKMSEYNDYMEMNQDLQYPEWQRKNAERLAKEELNEAMKYKRMMDEAALDVLDYNDITYNDFRKNYGPFDSDYKNPSFIEHKLREEYGPDLSKEEIDNIIAKAWSEYSDLQPNDLKNYK